MRLSLFTKQDLQPIVENTLREVIDWAEKALPVRQFQIMQPEPKQFVSNHQSTGHGFRAWVLWPVEFQVGSREIYIERGFLIFGATILGLGVLAFLKLK